jgi:hypothetical protein
MAKSVAVPLGRSALWPFWPRDPFEGYGSAHMGWVSSHHVMSDELFMRAPCTRPRPEGGAKSLKVVG